MENEVYFTYTCPVSRKTYAGHPRDGWLYENTNDIEEAIGIIHSLARKHGQPITWVINDGEYTNAEGLLHHFKRFREEGDSILVTMELTTSPAGVDKFDTKAVIKWIDEQSKRAGITPDGIWSLRFLESDLAALNELDPDEYPWTRNLAGSCWHQIGIDDATWGGCPYNPYYPSLRNVRMPARADENADFVMLEWLTRDIPAIVAGGYPATFTLDPADSNRRDAGGFDNEPDARAYSKALILETARQSAANRIVVVNVNEEARHFQTEGHDKAFMLDGMFEVAGNIPGVKRVTYRDAFNSFRENVKPGAARLFVCRSVDWRNEPDTAALFEDRDMQVAFLKSRGVLPVEVHDYSKAYAGKDRNDTYPLENISGVSLPSHSVVRNKAGIECRADIVAPDGLDKLCVVWWDTGLAPGAKAAAESSNIRLAKAGTDGCLAASVNLVAGVNKISITFSE